MEDAPTNGKKSDLEQQIADSRNYIINFLRKKGCPENDVEDLAQTALAKAIKYKDQFRGDSSVNTWVTQIAWNSLYDEKRRSKKKNEALIDLTPFGDEGNEVSDKIDRMRLPTDSANGIAKTVDQRERLRAVQEFINTLEEPRKGMFLDRVSGMKYEEIASKYEIPFGTVMSRLFYIRKKLHNFLKSKGIEEDKP